MEMRPFSTLAPKVNASLPGCPYPLVLQYIRESAIRVCERTLTWRYEQPSFTLTPGQAEYTFPTLPDTDVQAVLAASLNDEPVRMTPLEQAFAQYPEWPITTTDPDEIAERGSQPRVMTQVSLRSFVVLPMPDADRPYSVRFIYALKPSRDASDMPRAVMNEYEDAIVHGALQHLLVMPNVEWSDRELAAYHAKQFLLSVTTARAQANLTTFRGSIYATAPRFA
jgi:hypothetical protein